MTNIYWTEENLGSTIILSKVENGIPSVIHMTVYKDDMTYEDTTYENPKRSVRRFSTMTQNINDEISASVSTTPIVTYTAENAFSFDIKANEQFSISFVRKNPIGTVSVLQNEDFEKRALPIDIIDEEARKHGIDDRYWCNRHWVEELTSFVNRWQADSDGCTITFVPLDDSLQYAVTRNAYIRNFNFKFDTSSNEIVSGSIDVQIGSMTANAARAEDSQLELNGYNDPHPFDDMTVSMTSSDGLAKYILYCKDKTIDDTPFKLNCISDYTLKGGPEQPFEYLTMTISKKRLSVVAPNLLNDIIAGRNRIELNAMGRGQFIVTKCSSTSSSYRITAYSMCEIYRSMNISNPKDFGKDQENATPFNIIRSILSTYNKVGQGANVQPVYFTDNSIRWAYRKCNDSWSQNATYRFSNDSSAWYVMSVCALKLDCKIWFSDNYAYVIDTSITDDELTDTAHISTNLNKDDFTYHSHIPKLYLNTSDPYPLYISGADRRFTQSVCSTISLGDEGAETICNSVKIQFNSTLDTRDKYELEPEGYRKGTIETGVERELRYTKGDKRKYIANVTPYPLIAQSQARYGVRQTIYKIPEIGDEDAGKIAVSVANSYCDGEQSVGFKLKEMHIEKDENDEEVKYWQKYFPTLTHVDEIYDYSNDLVLTNLSNFICADVSEYVLTKNNYANNVTFEVPKGTWFRLRSFDTGGIAEDFRIFDANGNPITSKVQYTIIDKNEYNAVTVDIKIEQNCHIYTYKDGQSSGGTIYFILKDSRQKLPNKLCLSTFQHNFPEGTTEYWFGIMKPTDITQNTSEIHNAMYNQ